MDSNICEYCEKQLSTPTILKRHQQTAKYCLDIQNKKLDKQYKCECSKEFSRIDNYKTHIKTCKQKSNNDKDKTIESLLKVVSNLVNTKTNNNNNNCNNNNCNNNNITNNIKIINNLIHIDPEYLKQQSKFLSLNDITNGPTGYAEFVAEYLLKNRAICTDVSRGTIIYKEIDNKQIVDVKGIQVSKKIGIALVDENSKLCNKQKEKLIKEFENNYEATTEKTNKLHLSDTEIKRMSKGKDTKFKRKLINDLCSRLKSSQEIK